MKKIITFTLIILGMNFFLLFFPILFFLFNLSLSQSRLVDAILGCYPYLALLSPVLTIIFCIRLSRIYPFKHPWIGILTISLIGYSPIWLACILLSLCWNLRDFLWLILFPFTPGLIAVAGLHLYKSGKKYLRRAKFS